MRMPTPVYQNILVPLDGSDVAEYAIGYAVDLARAHHARLLLVCLADAIDAETAQLPLAAEQLTCQEAQARLQTLRHQLRAEDIEVETRVIDSAEPRAALERLIETESVQLIVMSTQGWTGMLRWVFGPDIERAQCAGGAAIACSPDDVQDRGAAGRLELVRARCRRLKRLRARSTPR